MIRKILVLACLMCGCATAPKQASSPPAIESLPTIEELSAERNRIEDDYYNTLAILYVLRQDKLLSDDDYRTIDGPVHRGSSALDDMMKAISGGDRTMAAYHGAIARDAVDDMLRMQAIVEWKKLNPEEASK